MRKPSRKLNQRVKKAQWHLDWPRSGDVKAWMECLLDTVRFADDPSKWTSTTVSVAIHELAKVGFVDLALSRLQEALNAVPENDATGRSWLLACGAEICFEHDRLEQMELFLQRKLDLQPLFARKCDADCQLRSVNQFRFYRGLLDPENSAGVADRPLAELRRACGRADEAFLNDDRQQALHHLRVAEKAFPTIERDRDYPARILAEAMIKCGDQEGLARLLREDDSADKRTRLPPRTLLQAGERTRAVRRLEQEIREALQELAIDKLNAHFPAMAFERAITTLVKCGERARARKWLKKAMDEGQDWSFLFRGAFSAAVFRSIAKAMAAVEGPEEAKRVLAVAECDAMGDKPSCWRNSAMREDIELMAELNESEAAIEQAQKIRSAKVRRRLLTRLLAKVGDFDGLHNILREAKDPAETADLIWWAKFAWRPPE